MSIVPAMLIAGIVLLLVAVAACFFARSERGDARKATATETMACGDVAGLSKGVADELGGGVFRQRCEVVGKAQPGPAGLLEGPESGVGAVWTRTQVTHKYWVMEETKVDGRITRNRSEREETVSAHESASPFAVADASGAVAIAPEGAEIDAPEQVLDRFDAAGAGAALADDLISSFLRSGNDSGTLGFAYEEWVIRPGARLYVQGEVADRTGELAFGKPEDGGPFLVSTRSEEEIVSHALRNAKIATGVAAVSGVLGLVLVVAGAVAG
jgi:hypothetical protein